MIKAITTIEVEVRSKQLKYPEATDTAVVSKIIDDLFKEVSLYEQKTGIKIGNLDIKREKTSFGSSYAISASEEFYYFVVTGNYTEQKAYLEEEDF